MGVNKTIARFFVDRKPPENNTFWEGKLLYIGFGNGYVSIPVFYDILFLEQYRRKNVESRFNSTDIRHVDFHYCVGTFVKAIGVS